MAGRGNEQEPETAAESDADRILSEMLALYRERTSLPGITGADLAAMGFRPGPEFREALVYARKLQLAGISREESLRQVEGHMRNLTGNGRDA